MVDLAKASGASRFLYTTLCYDSQPRLNRSLDVVEPNQATRGVSLLFVHGGGWTSGVRSIYHPIMFALRKLDYVCGSLDYRLAGGATALEQVDDVALGQ